MLRCHECRAVFDAEAVATVTSCPSCGSTIRPEDPAWDVTLTMNWKDLRVLSNFARRFALMTGDRPTLDRLDHTLLRLQTLAPSGAPGLDLS